MYMKMSSIYRTPTIKAKFTIWWRLACIGFLMHLISNCGLGEGALRETTLVVDPPAVRRGQHATLRCIYDLGAAPLYSVKFYRGQLEFYRYSPGEIPSSKVFAFPGIHVDISLSNASQVVIRNVGFGLSGNFSCEVTADAPYFSTSTAFVQMQVVELPEKGPSLWTEHDRYEPGDVLRANCSSPPSRPRAELKLLINNWVPSQQPLQRAAREKRAFHKWSKSQRICKLWAHLRSPEQQSNMLREVRTNDVQYIRTVDNLIASKISMKLHLQSSHFASGGGSHIMNSISSGVNNGIILKCTAQIGNLYHETAEIELGIPQRDPIPARVTSSNASRNKDLWRNLTSLLRSTTGTLLSAFVSTVVTAVIHHIDYTVR